MTNAITPATEKDPRGLPQDFVFSQSSLQTYVDCKRRFWLTYVVRLPWPAPPASPAREFEELMRLGAEFHRAVQRVEEGVTEAIPADLEYPLQEWLQSYRERRPTDLPSAHVEVERSLESPLTVDDAMTRLVAKYDLIAADAERTIIIDWKTGSRAPRPAILQQKLQTSVYPFVLVEASESVPWGPVRPEQVEMRYWFTAAPDQPVSFRYDSALHDAARTRITGLVREIVAGRGESDFPKVPDTQYSRKYVCGFCSYRGLCNRGAEATDLHEMDDVSPEDFDSEGAALDFSLADVEEIAF